MESISYTVSCTTHFFLLADSFFNNLKAFRITNVYNLRSILILKHGNIIANNTATAATVVVVVCDAHFLRGYLLFHFQCHTQFVTDTLTVRSTFAYILVQLDRENCSK